MKIQYAAGRKNSKYPSNYPLFKYEGIQQNLWPEHYPQFETFLDSVERLDFSRYSIRVPKSEMYRVNTLKGTNRIEVYVGKDEITVNRTPVTDDELAIIAYKFTKKYSPNYVIIFNANDQITFGRYIECLDLIYYQVEKLRNEMSLERYQQPLEYWYWQPELDSIRSKYPRRVLEWTREEKRLLEVMKKAGIKPF